MNGVVSSTHTIVVAERHGFRKAGASMVEMTVTRRRYLITGMLLSLASVAFAQSNGSKPSAKGVAATTEDWANLGRYREANEALSPPKPGEERVVFLGDSITDFWGRIPGSTFFPGKPYINRGISGQTTPQMLVRFRPDVVALQPAAVVILAGTNDIAGNTGPMTLGDTENNLMSMVDIALQNNIRVVLASVTPAIAFPWRPDIHPAEKIRALNSWIKEYAANRHLVYVDYYSAMVDEQGGMKANLSKDGVHPNVEGYRIMAPLADDAIAHALR